MGLILSNAVEPCLIREPQKYYKIKTAFTFCINYSQYTITCIHFTLYLILGSIRLRVSISLCVYVYVYQFNPLFSYSQYTFTNILFIFLFNYSQYTFTCIYFTLCLITEYTFTCISFTLYLILGSIRLRVSISLCVYVYVYQFNPLFSYSQYTFTNILFTFLFNYSQHTFTCIHDNHDKRTSEHVIHMVLTDMDHDDNGEITAIEVMGTFIIDFDRRPRTYRRTYCNRD